MSKKAQHAFQQVILKVHWKCVLFLQNRDSLGFIEPIRKINVGTEWDLHSKAQLIQMIDIRLTTNTSEVPLPPLSKSKIHPKAWQDMAEACWLPPLTRGELHDGLADSTTAKRDPKGVMTSCVAS